MTPLKERNATTSTNPAASNALKGKTDAMASMATCGMTLAGHASTYVMIIIDNMLQPEKKAMNKYLIPNKKHRCQGWKTSAILVEK